MEKIKMATVWLDGCSGCHMSFLDIDERLLEIADRIDLVYSPLVDAKTFPEDVDVTLVEGAVSSEEDLEKIKRVRARTRVLVSLGDCAVTSNVPSMRNRFPVEVVLDKAYREQAAGASEPPTEVVPPLLERSRPVHELVEVDVFVPGCPPSADVIFSALASLLEDRAPTLRGVARFG
jgi:NAD-reducing hydrogenase small subunit